MRERVISGFDDPKAKDDGITDFVKELKVTHPPAAAGLLGKLIPPADEAEPSGMIIGEVNILSIPRGTFLAAEQAKRIMSKDITIEEAKQIVADAMVSKAISDRKFDGEFIEIEEVNETASSDQRLDVNDPQPKPDDAKIVPLHRPDGPRG